MEQNTAHKLVRILQGFCLQGISHKTKENGKRKEKTL
jgi:hypothetical protein